MLEKLLQTLMDGLAVGSLYALIALGYTMVYGILKFINFAHSDVFVLGAWISYAAALSVGLGPEPASHFAAPWVWMTLLGVSIIGSLLLVWERVIRDRLGTAGVLTRIPRTQSGGTFALVAVWGWASIGLLFIAKQLAASPSLRALAGGVILLCAMSTCGLVGFCIERMAYKPLRKAPRLNVLITAIGVSLLLQNLGQLNWMFGTRPQGMPKLLPDRVIAEFGGDKSGNTVHLQLIDVIGAGTAIVLMVMLDWLVFHTKLGRAMRAVSFNDRTAALMGIPVNKVISFTFVLGAALAAAAGFLYGQKYPGGLSQTAAATWVLLGLKAFVAAVVGGIGNIRGAMLGGILIGLLEFFGAAYISAELKDVYVFAALIIVLLVRPNGLLGAAVQDKV